MANRFDIVIFGATGFTGKHVVKELLQLSVEKSVSWAIAGRSEDKLKKMLQELKDKTGNEILNSIQIIVADIKDEKSLKKMCEQARVVVNCCGPYILLGEPVIKACIATRTHHVDISAEPEFMEDMRLKYHKDAQENGVYIVNACGFGYVPTDLGVVDLQNKFDGIVNSVESYIEFRLTRKLQGAFLHYGTWESGLYLLLHANKMAPLRRNLFAQAHPEFKPTMKQHTFLHKSRSLGKWVIPFAGADDVVTSKSQQYFYEQDKIRPAQIKTYYGFESLWCTVFLGVALSFIKLVTKLKCVQHLVLRHPKLFSGGLASHKGPTDETRENTYFFIILVGKGWAKNKAESNAPPNKTIITKVSGTDPGYGGTAIMSLLCGITILKEADKMPYSGGVYTPGAAFAKTSLIEQLNAKKITFELISIKEE